MNKKGQMGIGMLIMMFIVVILGVALFTPTMNTVNQMTTKQDVSNQSVIVITAYVDNWEVNESINFTAYSQSDWKKLSCLLTSVAIRNGAGTALVADTDYTLHASEGVYSLLNTTKTVPDTSLNITYVDYTHCADGYNTNGGARSIIGIVLIFMALAIVAYMLPGIKDWL